MESITKSIRYAPPTSSKLDSSLMFSPRLLSLTTQVCDRLPGELRNKIYDYLLDDGIIKCLARQCKESMDENQIANSKRRSTGNEYIPDLKVLFTPFVRELAAVFYTTFRDHVVNDPSQIALFLVRDHFQCGLTVSQVSLAALTVRVSMPDYDSTRFIQDFEPLLDESQNWSSNFKLILNLTFVPTNRLVDYRCDAQELVEVISKLQPIFRAVESRAGAVYINLTGYSTQKPYLPIDRYLRFTEARWEWWLQLISSEITSNQVMPRYELTPKHILRRYASNLTS